MFGKSGEDSWRISLSGENAALVSPLRPGNAMVRSPVIRLAKTGLDLHCRTISEPVPTKEAKSLLGAVIPWGKGFALCGNFFDDEAYKRERGRVAITFGQDSDVHENGFPFYFTDWEIYWADRLGNRALTITPEKGASSKQ